MVTEAGRQDKQLCPCRVLCISRREAVANRVFETGRLAAGSDRIWGGKGRSSDGGWVRCRMRCEVSVRCAESPRRCNNTKRLEQTRTRLDGDARSGGCMSSLCVVCCRGASVGRVVSGRMRVEDERVMRPRGGTQRRKRGVRDACSRRVRQYGGRIHRTGRGFETSPCRQAGAGESHVDGGGEAWSVERKKDLDPGSQPRNE